MGKLMDLTNKKIGEWIVLSRETNSKSNKPRWRVRCKCGNETVLGAAYLKNGWKQKSCNCSKNLLGKKFGKLTITEREKINGKYRSNWKCECECGKIKTFRGDYILTGKVKSCGCAIIHSEEKIGPRTVYNHYKQAAKKRNLEFLLSKEEVKKIIESECFYCGTLKSNTFSIKKTKNGYDRFYSYNGIDRVDNKIGYTNNNSVSCCFLCNLMKRNLKVEEWLNHMKKIIFYTESNLTKIA